MAPLPADLQLLEGACSALATLPEPRWVDVTIVPAGWHVPRESPGLGNNVESKCRSWNCPSPNVRLLNKCWKFFLGGLKPPSFLSAKWNSSVCFPHGLSFVSLAAEYRSNLGMHLPKSSWKQKDLCVRSGGRQREEDRDVYSAIMGLKGFWELAGCFRGKMHHM